MKRLLQALDVFPEATLLIRGDGVILGSNPAARELFCDDLAQETKLASIVGDGPEKIRQALQLWSSSRHFLPMSLRLRDSGLILRCDGASLEPGGSSLAALMLVRCMRRSESATTKFFLQLNEQIEQLSKQMAEQKARDNERISSLATAAAVFAHEIANPLNAIGMSVQLLAGSLEGRHVDPALYDSIVEANTEITRLSALLRDFRSLARTQFIKLQSTDLPALIEEVLAPEKVLFQAADVRVRTEFSPLPALLVDRDRIKQALLNLIKNAVEAMPVGGSLTIRVYPAENESVMIEIADTGVGIPENIDVFEIFRTTKAHGTGLGLTIASQIISAHRGAIAYSSEPGRGTIFKVSLPATLQIQR